MTPMQRHGLRLSEIRQRLNEISGLSGEALTDEVRAEADKLTAEFRDVETQWRAAVVAEGVAEAEANGDAGDGDGQPAEVRNLRRQVSVQDYLTAAYSGRPLSGAAQELNDALEIRAMGGGVPIPWAVLADGEAADVEHRVDATTTTTQLGGVATRRPILQRLFARDIFAAMGVRLDSVPTGLTEWPLMTGGTDVRAKSEGAAREDSDAATFSTTSLKPKKLTGAFKWTYEQALQIGPDLEASLRRDLTDSVRNLMNDQLVRGNGTSPNITGLFGAIAAATDLSSAAATYATLSALHCEGVDGIHAAMESEVSSLIGIDTYRFACGLYQTGSGEAAIEALNRRGRSCMATPYIPAPVTANSATKQDAILHAGMDAMRGDSVAAVWPSLEVIRDPYSGASKGEIVLTWLSFWDARVALRADAYKRIAIQTA